MRPRFLSHVLLLAASALLLCACHGKNDEPRPGGSTPEAALQRSIGLLKAGHFSALWKQALPPADYATMRADWSREQQQPPAASAADRARFTAAMRQLTANDAGKTLFKQWQPRLTRIEQQYGDQLPVLISVGGALAKARVMQDQDLGSTEKTLISNVVDVLTPWARQAAWFDPAHTRQAVDILVATARKLKLKRLAQLHSMDFDTAMSTCATGYAGLKQLLAIYGLSVDDTLNSIRLSPVSSSNGHAVVRIDYTVLGKPLSIESNLVQQDGRWYSEDMLDWVRASHRRLIQSTFRPAGSATVPGPAASHHAPGKV